MKRSEHALEVARKMSADDEDFYRAATALLVKACDELESARPEVGAIVKEQKERGLTAEMIREHYPKTQHQEDECELCHFVFKIAEEAIDSI